MDGQEAGSQFENHPVDSYLSNILCYHPFEQLEPTIFRSRLKRGTSDFKVKEEQVS